MSRRFWAQRARRCSSTIRARGRSSSAAYGATKAAQIALAQSWAAETVKTGPRVHVLTPAPMGTATRARFFPGEDRATLAHPRDEAARIVALLG